VAVRQLPNSVHEAIALLQPHVSRPDYDLSDPAQLLRHCPIDRPEVVSHAMLTALVGHFRPVLETLPDQPLRALEDLLEKTSWIREIEASRWNKQRIIYSYDLARKWWGVGRDPDAFWLAIR
jgi:hypothetical protein